MTFEYPELSGKRLELLKEAAPKVRRVLTMYDPRDDSPKQGVVAAKRSAKTRHRADRTTDAQQRRGHPGFESAE